MCLSKQLCFSRKAVACICSPPSLPHFPFPHSYFPRTALPNRVWHIRCSLRLLSKKHPTAKALCSILDSTHCRLAAGAPFLGSSNLCPRPVEVTFPYFTQGNMSRKFIIVEFRAKKIDTFRSQTINPYLEETKTHKPII